MCIIPLTLGHAVAVCMAPGTTQWQRLLPAADQDIDQDLLRLLLDDDDNSQQPAAPQDAVLGGMKAPETDNLQLQVPVPGQGGAASLLATAAPAAGASTVPNADGRCHISPQLQ
jgi:hypothetical protein